MGKQIIQLLAIAMLVGLVASNSLNVTCGACEKQCKTGLCQFYNGDNINNVSICFEGSSSQCKQINAEFNVTSCDSQSNGEQCGSKCCQQLASAEVCLVEQLQQACKTGLSTWAIVGIVLGSIGGAGSIAGGIYFWKKRLAG